MSMLPTVEAYQTECDTLLEHVSAMRVGSLDDVSMVGDLVRAAKAKKKSILEFMDPLVAKAHESHKILTAARAGATVIIDQVVLIATGKVEVFLEEHKKKLEADGIRLTQDAVVAEKVRIEKTASLLESQGRAGEAAALRKADVLVPFRKEEIAVEGMSQNEDWLFDVFDESAVPREFMSIDEKKIRGVVKSLKGKASIPGVRIYPKTRVNFRG